MVTQCSVCKLDPERLKTINEALRNRTISLAEVAQKSRLTKSSLHRHSHHLDPLERSITIDKADDGTDCDLTKREILSRIEILWRESMDGLAASKAPITLRQANGATVELKAGDLRTRAAFLREGRHTLEAAADWSGYPRKIVSDRGDAMIQIVVPCPSQKPLDMHVVDIALPKRLT
jgi:hypothetical protein